MHIYMISHTNKTAVVNCMERLIINEGLILFAYPVWELWPLRTAWWEMTPGDLPGPGLTSLTMSYSMTQCLQVAGRRQFSFIWCSLRPTNMGSCTTPSVAHSPPLPASRCTGRWRTWQRRHPSCRTWFLPWIRPVRSENKHGDSWGVLLLANNFWSNRKCTEKTNSTESLLCGELLSFQVKGLYVQRRENWERHRTLEMLGGLDVLETDSVSG